MSGKYAPTKTYPVHSVGPDSFYDLADIPDNYEWLVYWYEIDGYEGTGIAFAALKDDLFEFHAFGHCSCHGPTDDWKPAMIRTREEMLAMRTQDPYLKGRVRSQDDYDYRQWIAIFPKIEELLAQKDRETYEPNHCCCSA
jgi:hypothetical protein